MVSDQLSRNSEPSYYVIEHEQSSCLAIVKICWHSFDPLGKVVDDHNNVFMTLS